MAVLRPFPVFAAYDDNGAPLALGKVYTYIVNTTTPKSTFTDKTEGASNANPTILDAAGRASIWFNGPTKVVLKDSADVTIATVDDIGTVDEFTTLQSESTTPATSGQIRLASADTIAWRDNGNTANLSLSKDTNDQFHFGGKLQILNKQDVAAAIVGTAADATVYTYTMPANAMLASKGTRVTWYFNHSTGSASVTYKLNFGATAIISTGSAVTGNGVIQVTVFNNTGVQNAQWAGGSVLINTTLVGIATAAPAENTANSVVISATFNVAATDQLTPKGWLVEAIN